MSLDTISRVLTQSYGILMLSYGSLKSLNKS